MARFRLVVFALLLLKFSVGGFILLCLRAAVFVGLFPATPPIVTLMVIVQMLYVHDVLGDDIHVMGPRE